MKRTNRCSAGFTLLELLVSLAIFLVVGGVALSLISKSLPLYSRQENMTSLNIGLRSAVAQMEQDAANAGAGFYVGSNIPAWPTGVTIVNRAGGSCYDSTTKIYGTNCFDTLNIITTDLATPPANLDATYSMASATTFDVIVPSGWTAANYAARFLTNDQLLLLTDNGSLLTTVRLTANGSVNGTRVRLTHAQTAVNGTNTCATPCNDPWSISTNANIKLASSFDANDWVLKLQPVRYGVDTTVATNPKLVRTVGTAAGEVVAEQIVGLKLGASLWNDDNGTDEYRFDAASYPGLDPDCPTCTDPYNFSRVRAIRISLIGRTTPATDPTYTFRNTFDGGAYQIQAVSVVVNPRNLSMRDQ